MLSPVALTCTRLLAQANAPVPSTVLPARILNTLELSRSSRSVAYSGPFFRPCPSGTPTTLGGIPGLGYTGALIEPWDEVT